VVAPGMPSFLLIKARVVQVTARKHVVTLEAGLVGLPRARLVLAHQARIADDIDGEARQRLVR
jgi:hypothetical protein